MDDPTLSARVVAEQPLLGVHAGSALLSIGTRLLAIHDAAFRLSWIDLPNLTVTPIVIAGDGAVLSKAEKPDFEAAIYAEHDRSVYLIGSGSTDARCKIARLELDSGAVSIAERPQLYEFVGRALELPTRPNIEGALLDGGRLVLFHRGVGGAPSARIMLRADVLSGSPAALLAPPESVSLGALDAVPLGITDTVGSVDRTIFVAAAEATSDAIADGTVTGSVIGLFDRNHVRFTRVRHTDGTPFRGKLEGLVVDEDLSAAWALTDADDPTRPTTLCRLELVGFAQMLTPLQRLLRRLNDDGLLAPSDYWTELPGQPMRSSADTEHRVATASALGVYADSAAVKAWIPRLPKLTALRRLWIKSRANQALFDAACQLALLERLHISWSSVERCDALERLDALTHLYLGNSPRLRSLAPLARVPALRALALQGIFREVAQLDVVAECRSLRGLELIGQDHKVQTYASLAPLGELTELRYLRLAAVRFRDADWRPLLKLAKLECLLIAENALKHWPLRAYQELHAGLPRLENDLIRLAATDTAFQELHRIR